MQVNVFQISKDIAAGTLIDTAFSFQPFKKELEKRCEAEHTIKAEFYRFILNKLNQYPELGEKLLTEDVVKYPDLLELIYAVLSPAETVATKFLWAIGTPVPGDIIYSTEAFKTFITNYNADPNTAINQGPEVFKKRLKDFIYRLVLKKLYHISSDVTNDTIYASQNEKNKLDQYLRIHIDTTYVTISAKDSLPELRPELIEQFLHENSGPEVLEEILPLTMFAIEGFSIITVEDVTPEQSIENIRLALVNDSADQNELFDHVTHSLQTLTGNSSIEFGLLPFLRINGKLIYDAEECVSSILVKASTAQNCVEETYASLVDTYLKNPRAIFFNEINEEKTQKYFYLKALKNAGIRSYAVLPVYYNRRLAGVMEIYSRKSVIYYEKLLSKLEAAVPLLSQLLHNSAEQFKQRIENVIRDEFTTLQQSVEWKFNEVAWNYIRQKQNNVEKPEVKSVTFKNVYPLYGAIDIRNSTNERNIALQEDMTFLLNKLSAILDKATAIKAELVEPEVLKKCNAWLNRISKQVTDNDEIYIKAYLQSKIYPLFNKLQVELPQLKSDIQDYFDAENEAEGEGFKHRRSLESSITLINSSLGTYFEKAQQELQKIYPCYFEKFRTDGVEYDIYTGQALNPDEPFNEALLNDFRRWQLKSMIDIIHVTDKLTANMDCKLRTTQLIFVHANPIDICFRKDERRFDVEGAYNIRYEVIKKRIDKVQIKDTGERLTQPGTIALVYTSNSEASEFLNYIKEYQGKQLLDEKVEYYELEELQGVTGLKALRVNVLLN